MRTADIDEARGERIRYVRVELLGLRSQAAFADWVGGVSRGAVGNWERGLDISLDNLSRIAQKAGVPFDWLAFGNGDRPAAPEGDAKLVERKLAMALAAFDELPPETQKVFLARVLKL